MNMIIARLRAEKTDMTDELLVCVREHAEEEKFEVFVDGGFLANGSDSYMTDDLEDALQVAAGEIKACLMGE